METIDDRLKRLGFKDFITVDHTMTGDEYLAYQAQKRRRGHYDTWGDDYTPEGNFLDEDMDAQQQRKSSQRMKRLAPRIQVAKKKAMKKAASSDVIDKRARQQARAELGKKFSGGKSKSNQSLAQRRQVNKKLSNQKDRIDALAKRKRTQVRTMDRERRASANKAD
jgi:hypothetical protein